MQLEGGAVAKSMNGNYRRDYSADYRLIAENGTIETDVYSFGALRVARANPKSGGYDIETIAPPYRFDEIPVYSYKDMSAMHSFERADVYLINVFIQAILGDSAAKKYMIDVYRALDMSTVGLLAYRSILSGSHSVGIPNFRDAAEREAWRNDRHSTDSSISAGSDLLPSCKSGSVVADDAVYERVRQKFDAAPLTFGSH